ncbi:MAG: hypothetical protein A3K41_02515 [Chloroflexi bacterium RIFOXYD12_FULL_57_15]|nr:MAG: hypothetical protein A3K41_02515 [Chloroflexi bacterium RIFOXYD12_FULL_57_15]
MTTKKPTEAQLEGKVVRLVWDSADDLPALYSNHLIVTHGGESEFHIIFGHLTPPLILAESLDEIPDRLVIKPVAKIVVTPQTMRKFIEAMNKNLERFEERGKEGDHVG